MKKNILIISLFFFSLNLHSQQLLKEISRTFDNGIPMFIDYLEPDNLKKVKTEIFNEEGTRIFSIQFNPNTGLADGEFFDLINKGFFKDGVLTCYKCMLVEANSPSVFTYNYNKMNTLITQGDVINGRLVGKVIYKSFSEDTYKGIDWEGTRNYVAAGAGIGFRDVVTYKTGQYKEKFLGSYYYNSNGVVDGEVEILFQNWKATIAAKNGIISSYVLKDDKGLVVDSLSRNNKIWKSNYKFVKNNGFPIIKSAALLNKYDLDFNSSNSNQYYDLLNYFIAPLNRSYELEEQYLNGVKGKEYLAEESFQDYGATNTNGVILLGGIQSFGYDVFNKASIYEGTISFDTGGPKIGLDNNGLYSISLTGALDNIISYSLDEDSYSNAEDPYNFKGNSGNRNSNLFAMIYNYLVNNDENLFKSVFYDANSFQYFVSVLSDKKWGSFSGNGNVYLVLDKKSSLKTSDKYILNNSFKKYIKEKPFLEPINVGFDQFEYSLFDFFNNVISLPDYLAACNESIKNKETEIQEIFVWDKVKNSYVLVDFNLLINKAIEKNKQLDSLNFLDVVMSTDQNSNVFSQELYDYKFELIEAMKNSNEIWSEFNIEKIEVVSNGSDDYYGFYLTNSKDYLSNFIRTFVVPDLSFYNILEMKNSNVETTILYYKLNN